MTSSKDAALLALRDRAYALGERIAAPRPAFPSFGDGRDFGHPDVRRDGDTWVWEVHERGQLLEQRRSGEDDDALYWIFVVVTRWMGSRWELAQRPPADDPRVDTRVAWAGRQLGLLAALEPRWAARFRQEEDSWLSTVALPDAAVVAVEAPERIPTARATLERISPALARRIVDRDERPGDAWHPEYPFVDELDPLASLAASAAPDPVFTMYLVRRSADGRAVGGFGFFGPPDAAWTVELGYGLVPAARGHGLAAEVVRAAVAVAAEHGARRAVADTEAANVASQRVLARAGFRETDRAGTTVAFARDLA